MERAQYQSEYGKQYRETVKRSSLTFSQAEFEKIESLAEALDLKPAVFLKRLVLAAIEGNTIQSQQSSQEFQDMRFLLRSIANNLNQIARHSNTVGHVLDENAVLQNIRQFEEAASMLLDSQQSGEA